jgi:urease subunit alpha
LQSAIAVVKGCRTVKKADMIHNDLPAEYHRDAQTMRSVLTDILITEEPADVLMAQRYFLF